LRAFFGRKVCLDDKRSGLVSGFFASGNALVECFHGHLMLTENTRDGCQNTRLVRDHQGDLKPAVDVG
jgi:hypothetical protein